MKYGKSFDYNGASTKDFNLIIVSDENISDFGMSKELLKGSSTKYRKTYNHFGAKYSNPLVFNIKLIKDVNYYSTQKELLFNENEISNIVAWLTSNDIPTLLHFKNYCTNADENIDYFGVFTDIVPYVQNECVFGFITTFTCSSSYGFTKEYNYILDTTNSSIEIESMSDEYNDFVYPVIEIAPHSTGTIVLKNETDNDSMTLNVQNGNNIYIDCANQIIKNEAGNLKLSDLGVSISDISTFYWFRLLSEINVVTLSGNATVTIRCRYPKKVGAF